MSDTQVWMCFGCCCGVRDVDVRHKPKREPIERIQSALKACLANGGLRDIPIVKTGCLGPCERGNMVVIRKPGIDAVVLEKINTTKLGERVAEYAIEMEKRGWGARVPGDLEAHIHGTINADEVPPPPDPAPYADRHR